MRFSLKTWGRDVITIFAIDLEKFLMSGENDKNISLYSPFSPSTVRRNLTIAKTTKLEKTLGQFCHQLREVYLEDGEKIYFATFAMANIKMF
jgi:hypothetical protein